MVDRIGDEEIVVSVVDTIDWSVGIHAGVPLVGGDLVVHKGHVVGPVPHRDDHIPFHAGRTRWRFGNLAAGNALGPVGEHLQTTLAAVTRHEAVHSRPALPPLDAMIPRSDGRVELCEIGNFASGLAPDLMTTLAAFHVVYPLTERLEFRIDAVAARAGARELTRLWRLEQRQPIVGRIDLRGGLRRRRHQGRQIQVLIRRGRDRLRIDQPIAAHPDLVVGLRELRQ